MTTLIYADHDAGQLSSATLAAVTAARQIGDDIHILVTGQDVGGVAEQATAVPGVSKVLQADGPHLASRLAENVAPVVERVTRDGGYGYLLAGGTSSAKAVLPRVAAKLDVQQISEISKVISADTFVRPIYAGNALATVQSHDPVKVITVRSIAFEPSAAEGGSAAIEAVEAGSDAGLSQFLEQFVTQDEGPSLANARIVISGGRGLGSAENFKMIQEIADKVGAAVGASRAAVDAGYVPNDYQVGQSGKAVAPDLYIAVGISGAVHHLAGMKDSKVIVAINNDPDAPIFEVADYGLVADLFEALPQLRDKLAAAVAA